jgi:hypothetical protein
LRPAWDRKTLSQERKKERKGENPIEAFKDKYTKL